MHAMTTEAMLRLVLLEPGRCPVCDWPYRGTMCKPGDCSYRPERPTEQRIVAENRRTFARVEPLLKAAYRNAVVHAHIGHLRHGDHPDLVSALVGMVASLDEQNRHLLDAAVMRRLAEPPALDLSAYGGSIEAAAEAGGRVLAERQLGAQRAILDTLAANLPAALFGEPSAASYAAAKTAAPDRPRRRPLIKELYAEHNRRPAAPNCEPVDVPTVVEAPPDAAPEA